MAKNQSQIQEVIDKVLSEMEYEDPGTDKYRELTEQLGKLYEIKSKTKDRLFSPDTILIVGANLLGLILVLTYERANIITSKAFGMILRTRL